MDAVRSLVAVVFAVLAVYDLAGLRTHRDPASRIGHLVRAGASVAMVAMLGPWAASPPEPLGLLAFSAAAFWFGYLALFRPGLESHPWFDCAKMLAMAWMYVAMSPSAMSFSPPSPSASGHAGMSGHMHMSAEAAAASMSTPTWSAVIPFTVAVALLASGVLRLRPCRTARIGSPAPATVAQSPTRLPTHDTAAAAMSLGMAFSLFILL